MTKLKTRSLKCIREKIQTQLLPLYKMVRESLEASVIEMKVQLNAVVTPPDAKRMKISDVTVGDQNINE